MLQEICCIVDFNLGNVSNYGLSGTIFKMGIQYRLRVGDCFVKLGNRQKKIFGALNIFAECF
jgi:hypothetical protein